MSSLMLADPGLDIDASEKLNEETWRRALHELRAARSHLGEFFQLARGRLEMHSIFSPDDAALRSTVAAIDCSAITAAIPLIEMHLMFRYDGSAPLNDREHPACFGVGCKMTPEGPQSPAPEEAGVV
jgi:hypothetical protein